MLTILLLLCGALLFCRSFSFVVMQSSLYADRDSWCLPRLVKQQKSTDLMTVLYNLCVTFIGIWLCIYASWYIFSTKEIPMIVRVICPIILLVLFCIYHAISYILNRKYGTMLLYDEVVNYRKKQDVVTQDNDYEVNFIKGVRRTIKEKQRSICWMGFLIGMIIFQVI